MELADVALGEVALGEQYITITLRISGSQEAKLETAFLIWRAKFKIIQSAVYRIMW